LLEKKGEGKVLAPSKYMYIFQQPQIAMKETKPIYDIGAFVNSRFIWSYGSRLNRKKFHVFGTACQNMFAPKKYFYCFK